MFNLDLFMNIALFMGRIGESVWGEAENIKGTHMNESLVTNSF